MAAGMTIVSDCINPVKADLSGLAAALDTASAAQRDEKF
jgi:hypothetical protein